mgnify:CR=1 FL=1
MFIELKKTKDDKSNFYLSGVLAFGLYLLFLLLVVLYLKSQDIKKFDAISKITILELDIVIEPKKQEDVKPVKNRTDQIDTKKSNKIVKKSTSTSAKKRSDLKSLFSKVKTQAPKVSKQKILNVKKSTVASRFKSKFEKQQKSKNITVSKLLDSVKSKSSVQIPTDTKNKNDEYYSKIYELLASRWNPMLIIDGLSAKVLVVISSDGEFDYRFLRNSGDTSFDDSLRAFLEEQKAVAYPSHSRGSTQEIAVTFTAEKG